MSIETLVNGLGSAVTSTDLGALGAQALETVLGRQITDSNNPGLNQTKYDFNYRSFPADLGSDYNNHYMVININIPVNAKQEIRGAYYRATSEDRNFASNVLPSQYSKVDNLRFNVKNPIPIEGAQGSSTSYLGGIINSNIGQSSELYSPIRSTRRIAESIALYMPSPMIYNQLNVYEDISLTHIFGQAGKLAAKEVSQAIGGSVAAYVAGRVEAARRAQGAAGRLVNTEGNIIGTAFALAGYPINPRIEVIFSNTTQRQFNFEFLMAPRNEKESFAMKEIIKTLRFHAAPELQSFTIGGTGLGIPTYIPPAEFDITFYNGSKENINIPRINTCVLERCEVDYAPSGGWATFSNGQPIAARLSLAFREIEIIHKRRVVQGF